MLRIILNMHDLENSIELFGELNMIYINVFIAWL